MDKKLSSAPKDALVEIVKLAQKRKMKGDQGEWKEFLSVNDNKFGASMSDPSRRTPEVLLKFLRSFNEVEDLNYFNKVFKSYLNRELGKQLGHVHDAESPEQRLVRLTLEHPMYPMEYSFPSHEEGWVITKLKKAAKLVKSNLLLAVDCEMVLCDDGTEALIKICVVDRNLQVKLHEFVKPHRKVVDYRTDITGVSADDLEEVTSSLEDIQESLKKLLSRTAILVGHGLSNDLKVLKIDHARVIDTSYIFKYGDKSAKRKPSLNGLCKSVLGYELRKMGAPHNCFDDACAAMKLVVAKLEKGFDNVLPVAHDMVEMPDSKRAKLFVHRIPVDMPCDELRQYVPGDFTIEIQTSKKGRGDKYSAFAIFATPEDALDAYDKLQGDVTTVDPEIQELTDGPSLPTRGSDEFRPFVRRLPEFKFWYSITKAFCIAFVMTFFSIFDVPVFWPILLFYWFMLFTLTMRRQIHHMIKYKYVPFSLGKKRYDQRKPAADESSALVRD